MSDLWQYLHTVPYPLEQDSKNCLKRLRRLDCIGKWRNFRKLKISENQKFQKIKNFRKSKISENLVNFRRIRF